jgi:hypothetical protein
MIMITIPCLIMHVESNERYVARITIAATQIEQIYEQLQAGTLNQEDLECQTDTESNDE